MFLLFGDKAASIFDEAEEIIPYVFSDITIRDLIDDNSEFRRQINRIIRDHKNIDHVVFYFGQVELCEIPSRKTYTTYIKLYVEWIANLLGRFKRTIFVPHYKISINSDDASKATCSTNSLLQNIQYFEYIYIFTKCVNEYKLGNTLSYVDINGYILDSNLIVKNKYRKNESHNDTMYNEAESFIAAAYLQEYKSNSM